MHELFRLDEIVPVAPGQGPFHVRGLYYSRILDHAKGLSGGVNQFLDELADARVRDFMRRPFQFMGWYDAFPTLPCQVALARASGRPLEEFIRERSRLAMAKLIPSMFRPLAILGGPRLAAPHTPRLIQTYFDFIEVKVAAADDRGAAGTASGVPLYLAPVTINTVLGILVGSLESLGARDVRARYDDVVLTGMKDGFETVSFRASFSWSVR